MDNEKNIKTGTIGSGRIASRFVNTKDDGISVSAVYNPHFSSAESFAKAHGIEYYGDDLNSFFDKSDAVYIATPHETHGMYVRNALEAGKNVLCEKPRTLSGSEAAELFAPAMRVMLGQML